MSSPKKSFYIILLILFSLDYILSNLIFKKTIAWNKELYQPKIWRVISENYHHDLAPLINVSEKWGPNEQKLITNSLGFRDASNRTVKKKSDKIRILLIGDSFIEGLGYNYQFTLSGLLQEYYGSKYEILNSAVASYSPSIYYFKTKYLIDKGYEFDEAFIFLDVSDIIDETYLDFNRDGSLKSPKIENIEAISLKKKIYRLGYFLRDNFVTFRLLSILSEQTEVLKNYIKDRYKATKTFNKSFLTIKKNELNLYRMINVDRGNWTRENKLSFQAEIGLKSSEKYLDLLFSLLNKKKIKSYLIIYPWPSQIYYNDNFHKNYWAEFSIKKNVNFLNFYPYFTKGNKIKTINNNFIPGDVHWNKNGTHVMFEAIKEMNILRN